MPSKWHAGFGGEDGETDLKQAPRPVLTLSLKCTMRCDIGHQDVVLDGVFIW